MLLEPTKIMHDMFTMREKPRDKIGWRILNFFDIGDFILVSIGVIIKMKQSIVHFHAEQNYY